MNKRASFLGVVDLLAIGQDDNFSAAVLRRTDTYKEKQSPSPVKRRTMFAKKLKHGSTMIMNLQTDGSKSSPS